MGAKLSRRASIRSPQLHALLPESVYLDAGQRTEDDVGGPGALAYLYSHGVILGGFSERSCAVMPTVGE